MNAPDGVAGLGSGSDQGPPAREMFIRGANVLDETGGFDGPLDVVVERGVVIAVGRDLSPGEAEVVLEGDGLWLLPGVFDCHVHTGLSSFDTLELLGTPFSRRVLETAQVLRRTLHAGVTFVRDAGIADAGVRDAVAAGYVPGPSMQVSVVAIGSTGGHTDGFLAGPGLECSVDYSLPDYPGRPPHIADGPEEMRKAVRLSLRSGADWIKLIATGGVLASTEGGFGAELSFEDIAVAVSEAGRRGRHVMVHALGGEAIGWAVQAGARSIEHAVFLTEADAAAMAARGCAFVPTLAVYERLATLARSGALGRDRAERAIEVGAHLGEAVRIARAAGVKIALGSDFGHRDDHGHNLAELGSLQRAGLSVEDALLAATSLGAELCGVSDYLGRIAPGYEFDAIVLDNEPADLSGLSEPGAVSGVFKRGRPVVAHPRLRGHTGTTTLR
jgi:imidazolonepropionase-like amidohydrolase